MNKSILLLIGLPLLGSCSLSQGVVPRSAFLVGMQRSSLGVTEYESSTQSFPGGTDIDTDALRVSFTHGWFLSPTLEVGAMLGYRDLEVGTFTSNAWTADAYGRWYFENRARLRTWGQVYAGIGSNDNGTTDNDITEFGLGVGVSDMVSDRTSLDLGLDYRMSTEDTTAGDVDTDGLYITAAISLFYGQ